jgi:hypothetical protein
MVSGCGGAVTPAILPADAPQYRDRRSEDGDHLIGLPFRRFYQTSGPRNLQKARPESSGNGGIGAGEPPASHLFLLFYQVRHQVPSSSFDFLSRISTSAGSASATVIFVQLPFPHYDQRLDARAA